MKLSACPRNTGQIANRSWFTTLHKIETRTCLVSTNAPRKKKWMKLCPFCIQMRFCVFYASGFYVYKHVYKEFYVRSAYAIERNSISFKRFDVCTRHIWFIYQIKSYLFKLLIKIIIWSISHDINWVILEIQLLLNS